MLVLRVWYLFSHSTAIRLAALFSFSISIGASLAFVFEVANELVLLPSHGTKILGCQAERPPHFWRLFVPSLVVHVSIELTRLAVKFYLGVS